MNGISNLGHGVVNKDKKNTMLQWLIWLQASPQYSEHEALQGYEKKTIY